MLRWLRRKSSPFSRRVAPSRGRLPPGTRVYAVGDIHGRHDLLVQLEGLIEADLRASPADRNVTVVYLGDYVDRGPQSRNVLELLSRLPQEPVERRFLLGNHDYWLREFLGGHGPVRVWLQSGGDATLRSYGIHDLPHPGDSTSVDAVRRKLLRRMPATHRRFLAGLLPCWRLGDYVFAHAGIRPGLALEAQELHDLISIREPFLSDASDFEVVVVHGHTVSERPDVRANRIGIDTGACWTERLTALVLEDTEVRFLATA